MKLIAYSIWVNGAFVADVNHSFFTCLVSHLFGDGCSPWLEPQNIVVVVQLIKVVISLIKNPASSAYYQ